MKSESLLTFYFISKSDVSLTYYGLGHNLNLGHSGEGTSEYDDQSGMMVRYFILDSAVDRHCIYLNTYYK
jgi:hypothetical protein